MIKDTYPGYDDKNCSGVIRNLLDFKSDNVYDIGFAVNLFALKARRMIEDSYDKQDDNPDIIIKHNKYRFWDNKSQFMEEGKLLELQLCNFTDPSSEKPSDHFFVHRVPGEENIQVTIPDEKLKKHYCMGSIIDDPNRVLTLGNIKEVSYHEHKLIYPCTMNEPHCISLAINFKDGSSLEMLVEIEWAEHEDVYS